MTISIDNELEPLELNEDSEDLKPMQLECSTKPSKKATISTATTQWLKILLLTFLIAALAFAIFVDYCDRNEAAMMKTKSLSKAETNFSPSSLLNNKTRGSPVKQLKNTPAFSILPKRIYSVIGLEDSGTQFVSRVITKALNKSKYREGSSFCSYENCTKGDDIMVQHFSLPWGSTCNSNRNPPVVDVVIPSQCARQQKDPIEAKQCRDITKDIWGFAEKRGAQVKYPKRYQLDIVSHKKWYDAHGVEQFFIIVVRDEKISSIARARTKHCRIPILRDAEEKVGTDIIVNAINTYILADGEEKVTSDTYKYWAAETFQRDHDDKGSGKRKLSALPFGNNVALVSYETMMKLGPVYIQMLYEVLGIESNYLPHFKDGNVKYVNPNPKP